METPSIGRRISRPEGEDATRRGQETPSSETLRVDGAETGTVEFKDVSFRYPDASEDCLKHISFSAKKGETVAFIGATGSENQHLPVLPQDSMTTSGKVLVDLQTAKNFISEYLYNQDVVIADAIINSEMRRLGMM